MGANYSSIENPNVYRNGLYSTPTPTPTPTPKPSSSSSGVVIAFHSSAKWKAHFEASKQSGKLMVIDFTATWCGPCRFMEPALKEFAAKYTNVEFIKIDVDELEDVAQEFGVQAMPTFLLIKNGKEVDKVVGAKKDDLMKKIEKHGVNAISLVMDNAL